MTISTKNGIPTNFDARAWVKVVKDTGAKYVVFLTKHHDGFCLCDTKQTDYNIMNGPFKRDVTKELADACRGRDRVLPLLFHMRLASSLIFP